MKKVFLMEDLDCAHCASKMAEEIRKIEGVQAAEINFFTQKLTLEAEEEAFEGILKKAVKVCKRIEPDCRIRF
ncbi:MAG: heavy-metal-associated domain-containing protein [Clostridia bacterium]|nr:heavy-metal-associated domain-containing protein [Clostridia bacterium]